MAERATINRHYHIRILVMGLACVVLSTWFLRDGYEKYPEMKAIHEEYVKTREQYPNDWQQRWADRAQEMGWPDVPVAKTNADIVTQKIIGFILLPLGVFVLLRFLFNLRRWIEMDEHGLRDQSGRDVRWDQITGLDKSRWDRKGIAVVQYTTEKGQGRLVLDDWKFNRELIVQMVKRVDEQLQPQETQESQEIV